MGILNFTGFESGDYSDFTATSVTNLIVQSTVVRGGSYALKIFAGNAFNLKIGAPLMGNTSYVAINPSTMYVTFWFRSTNVGSDNVKIVQCYDNFNGLKMAVSKVNSTLVFGHSSTLATSGTISANEWHRVDMKMGTGGSAAWEFKVDGTSIGSGTTSSTGTHTSVQIASVNGLGSPSGTVASEMYIDDLIIRDDNFHPTDSMVQMLIPTGVGNYTDFTASAGNTWECIDEIPYTNNGDNVSAQAGVSNPGTVKRSTFAMSDLSGSIDSIDCVRPILHAWSPTNASSNNGFLMVRSGSTDSVHGSTLMGSWREFNKSILLTTDPNTASAWDEAGVNALEVGAYIGTSASWYASVWQIYVAYAEVLYVPGPPPDYYSYEATGGFSIAGSSPPKRIVTANGGASLSGSSSVTARLRMLVSGGASLSGSSSVTARLKLSANGGTSLNGSAIVSATGNHQGSATLISSSSISGLGNIEYQGEASLIASSSFVSSAGVIEEGSASLTGDASIAALGKRIVNGSALLVNNSTISALGTIADSAKLICGSTITANGTLLKGGRANLVGTASLNFAPLKTKYGSASLVCNPQVAPLGIAHYRPRLNLINSASLGLNPEKLANGAASLIASSSLISNPKRTAFGGAALAGSASMDAESKRTAYGSVSISGGSSVEAGGLVDAQAQANLVGSNSISARGSKGNLASAGLIASSAVSGVGKARLKSRAVLTGQATLSNSGAILDVMGASSLVGSSSINPLATRFVFGSANLTNSSSQIANGKRSVPGSSSMVSSSSLQANPKRTAHGAIALNGSASMDSEAKRTAYGSVSIVGGSSFAAGGLFDAGGFANLTSTSSFTSTANSNQNGAANLTTSSDLVATSWQHIIEAWAEYIDADETINALLGERMYALNLPQHTAYPAICFRQVSNFHEHNLNGASGTCELRLQVEIISLDEYEKLEIATALEERLHGFMGQWGNVKIGNCELEAEVDADQIEEDGDIFRRIQDYSIWYLESKPVLNGLVEASTETIEESIGAYLEDLAPVHFSNIPQTFTGEDSIWFAKAGLGDLPTPLIGVIGASAPIFEITVTSSSYWNTLVISNKIRERLHGLQGSINGTGAYSITLANEGNNRSQAVPNSQLTKYWSTMTFNMVLAKPSAVDIEQGSASLETNSSITGTGTANYSGSSLIDSESNLVANGMRLVTGSSSLESESSLDAAGLRIVNASSSLNGDGSIAASGDRSTVGSASLISDGSIIANGERIVPGASSLVSSSSLDASGQRIVNGAASLVASSTVAADGTVVEGEEGGILFNGTTSKLENVSANLGLQGTDQITILVWAYADGNGENGLGRICTMSEINTNPGYALLHDNSGPNILRFINNRSVQSGDWTFPCPDGQWNAISIAFDRSSTSNVPTIRVNYSPVTATLKSTPPSGVNSTIATGYCVGNQTEQTRTWDGGIRDFQVFNSVLSDADCDAGLANPGSITTNLRVHLPMTNALDLNDASGNGLHGTGTALADWV